MQTKTKRPAWYSKPRNEKGKSMQQEEKETAEEL